MEYAECFEFKGTTMEERKSRELKARSEENNLDIFEVDSAASTPTAESSFITGSCSTDCLSVDSISTPARSSKEMCLFADKDIEEKMDSSAKDMSMECEERYDFRQTTRERRKSPCELELKSKGSFSENIEMHSAANSPTAESSASDSSYCSLEHDDTLSELACDVFGTTVDSVITPTSSSKKRKCSFVANDIEKKRKVPTSISRKQYGDEAHTWIPHNTIIQPFNFSTDGRLKHSKVQNCNKEVDFISTLRRCSPRLHQVGKPRNTKTQPFSFDVNKKVKQQHQISEPKNSNEGSAQKLRLAIPQSPKLRTLNRHRPVEVLSREQAEELEVEEMKKWKFHAKPVDSKLFAVSGIPKVEPKKSTKPEVIQLETEKRLQARATRAGKNSPKKYEFHAQPVPKHIFKEPTGLKQKVQLPLTIPRTPNFSARTRAHGLKEESLMEVKAAVEKASKAPSRSRKAPLPSVPDKLSVTFEKRLTEVQPFSFEGRDKERFEKKKAKIEKIIKNEKMLHKFKANPMPIPGNSLNGIPVVPKKSPTKPEPFNLRGELAIEKKAHKVKQIENELQLKSKGTGFKAKPAAVIHKPAFQPHKSTKPLTEINEFHLYTNERAVQWQAMDEVNKTKVAEFEAMQEHLNRENEEKEKQELAKLRQQVVHKANPIRHFRPLIIKESDKPLTEPVSPQLLTNKRFKRI